MSEETRIILEKLESIGNGMQIMQKDIGEMKHDVAGLRMEVAELKSEVNILKADVETLKADMAMLKADVEMLKSDVNALKVAVNRLDNRVSCLETDMHALRLLVENEINRKIDIIGEGHDFLMRHYHKAEGELKAKEKMELDILGLKADMRVVKLKVGIAQA